MGKNYKNVRKILKNEFKNFGEKIGKKLEKSWKKMKKNWDKVEKKSSKELKKIKVGKSWKEKSEKN